jgi:hypothetical protein
MQLIRVVLTPRQLIGSAESDQIWSDTTMPCLDQRRDHFPVQVGPRRLAMHQQDGSCIARALVQEMDPVTVDVYVMRRERKIREALKAIVRRSQNPWFHGRLN